MSITELLSHPLFLGIWFVQTVAALTLLIRDLRRNNAHLPSLMKAVWTLTVVYSGLLGLAIYWISGRKEIPEDTDWRRGFRSVAHCYSGCGAGEVAGIVLAVGILALSTGWVVAVTFSFAYIFGIALTTGPLMQEGVGLGEALVDALTSETASIVVMEAVAIGSDLLLAGEARMGDVLFWSSLIVSLTFGLIAAYPVNVLLIKFGVKSGMADPREGAAA